MILMNCHFALHVTAILHHVTAILHHVTIGMQFNLAIITHRSTMSYDRESLVSPHIMRGRELSS